MKRVRNVLIVASLGAAFAYPAYAQLLGEYGGDNLPLTAALVGNLGSVAASNAAGGNLGSVTSSDIPYRWRTYKEEAGFYKKTDRRGRVIIITDPKRQEVETLMQASFDLVKEKKYDEALVKLQQLEVTEGKLPEETYFMHRMRVSIASLTDNEPLLVKSLEAAVASGLAADEQALFVRVLSYLYANRKDLPQTIAWTSRYLHEAGPDEEMHTRLLRAYYLNGEYAAAARELRVNIAADELVDKVPDQLEVRLLVSAEYRAGNQAGFNDAVEKSLTWYPKKGDWLELLNAVLSRPEFDGDLGLEAYRLMYKTGQFTTATDYMNMAQLTLRSGFPAEARDVLKEGYKAGVLGKGASAAAQKQLLDVATKRVAVKRKVMAKEEAEAVKTRDGDSMVHVGYSYVTNGQFDKGIELIEQGLAVGGIRHSDHARLRLGMALGAAGRNAEALQALKAVQGNDGAAELARYWAIQLRSHATL